jgi:hypothetical protein
MMCQVFHCQEISCYKSRYTGPVFGLGPCLTGVWVCECRLMKIRPVGVELFPGGHKDKRRQTDRHNEVKSRFAQFCERA